MKTKAFTLIELMAVIVIMAMILTVAFPALKAMSSTGLSTASRQLSSGMQLARQYAITMRTPVRVLLATDMSITNSTPAGSNIMCRAFSVYYPSNNVSAGAIDWWPLQDWRSLPSGVIILDHWGNQCALTGGNGYLTTAAPSFVSTALQTSMYDNTNYPMRVITNTISGLSATNYSSFLEFSATGAANPNYLPASGVGAIRLAQGAVLDARSHSVVVNDQLNWVVIEYDSFMGRVRIRYPDSY